MSLEQVRTHSVARLLASNQLKFNTATTLSETALWNDKLKMVHYMFIMRGKMVLEVEITSEFNVRSY